MFISILIQLSKMHDTGRDKGNANKKIDSENHLNLKTVPVCRLPHKNGDSPEILLKTFKMTSI